MDYEIKIVPRRARIYKLSTFDTLTLSEWDKYNEIGRASKEEKPKRRQEFYEKLKKFNEQYSGIKVNPQRCPRKGHRGSVCRYSMKCNEVCCLQSEKKNLRRRRISPKRMLVTNDGEVRINDNKIVAVNESQMLRLTSAFDAGDGFPLVREIIFLEVGNGHEAVLDQIMDRGIFVNGTLYQFYSSSANQQKKREITLIQRDFFERHKNQIFCGLSTEKINSRGGCNTGKYMAYCSLALSSSVVLPDFPISIDECLVVDDFTAPVHGKYEYIDIDGGTRKVVGIYKRDQPIPITHTDGCGVFLPGTLPRACQVRGGFIKGALFPFDFRSFIFLHQDNVKDSILDAWGNEHSIEEIQTKIKVIFTKSQLKMWKYYDNWEHYKECFKASGQEICINKLADEPRKKVWLPYQPVLTLDPEKLTDERMHELCGPTIEYLNSFKTDKEKMVQTLNDHDRSGFYNTISAAVSLYPDMVHDNYIYEKIQQVYLSERNNALGSKLVIPDSCYSYICPDLYGFAQWLFLGMEEPEGILPPNYVYNSFFNPKSMKQIDCIRSPHLYFSEHAIRNLADGETARQCAEWFPKNTLVINNHDLLTRQLMCDVDGDEALCCGFQPVIDSVRDNVLPLYYSSFKAEPEQINKDSLFCGLLESFGNVQIGDISNALTKIYSQPQINSENVELAKVLCAYNNSVIDYPKAHMRMELGTYQGQYDSFVRKRSPYFFQWAKSKKKAACSAYNESNGNAVSNYVSKRLVRNYKWFDGENDSIKLALLRNHDIPVDRDSIEYKMLRKLIKNANGNYKKLIQMVEEECQRVPSSDGVIIRKMRYDLFYFAISRAIQRIFFLQNGTDEERTRIAGEYLIDIQYFDRMFEKNSKDILWNIFGNQIVENIKSNLDREEELPVVRRKYRNVNEEIQKHITAQLGKLNPLNVEKSIITLSKSEIRWLDSCEYEKEEQRWAAFIFLILSKKTDSGRNVYVHLGSKKRITPNKIDLWAGEMEPTLAFEGKRKMIFHSTVDWLEQKGMITVDKKPTYYKITVNVASIDEDEIVFTGTLEDNPLMLLVDLDGSSTKKTGTCIICGKRFIKGRGNRKTCSQKCSDINTMKIKKQWATKK